MGGNEQSGMLVAHVILVSAQVLLVLTLGLWTLDFGLGLDNFKCYLIINISKFSIIYNQVLQILHH